MYNTHTPFHSTKIGSILSSPILPRFVKPQKNAHGHLQHSKEDGELHLQRVHIQQLVVGASNEDSDVPMGHEENKNG